MTLISGFVLFCCLITYAQYFTQYLQLDAAARSCLQTCLVIAVVLCRTTYNIARTNRGAQLSKVVQTCLVIAVVLCRTTYNIARTNRGAQLSTVVQTCLVIAVVLRAY